MNESIIDRQYSTKSIVSENSTASRCHWYWRCCCCCCCNCWCTCFCFVCRHSNMELFVMLLFYDLFITSGAFSIIAVQQDMQHTYSRIDWLRASDTFKIERSFTLHWSVLRPLYQLQLFSSFGELKTHFSKVKIKWKQLKMQNRMKDRRCTILTVELKTHY